MRQLTSALSQIFPWVSSTSKGLCPSSCKYMSLDCYVFFFPFRYVCQTLTFCQYVYFLILVAGELVPSLISFRGCSVLIVSRPRRICRRLTRWWLQQFHNLLQFNTKENRWRRLPFWNQIQRVFNWVDRFKHSYCEAWCILLLSFHWWTKSFFRDRFI